MRFLWRAAALVSVTLLTLGLAPGAVAATASGGTASVATTGSVGGKVRDSHGVGLANIGVELADVNQNEIDWAITDSTGAYSFTDVAPGQYLLMMQYPNNEQVWYKNTTDPSLATPITVAAGQLTKVSVTEPPFGSMSFLARDAVTKAPLSGICFSYSSGPFAFQSACTDATGVAVVSGIPVGTYSAGAYDATQKYLGVGVSNVVVRKDQTTSRTVGLHQAAVLHLSYVDAKTGDPAGGACTSIMPATGSTWAYPTMCSGSTEDVPLDPQSFRLFVAPSQSGPYGAQWVGPNGGTGNPATATVYKVTYGQQLSVTVRLDAAGIISGTVTDAATGATLDSVCPTPTGPSDRYYPAFDSPGCTYTDGVYGLGGLGPYKWKVVYPDYSGNHAWTWSGGGVNRATATTIQVKAGVTTTVNQALLASGKITGTITVPAGQNVQNVSVDAIDTATGEYAGIQPYVHPDGTYTIAGLNTQKVRIVYQFDDTKYTYPTTLNSQAGQTITGINLAVPAT